MLSRHISTLVALWPAMLIGTSVVLVSTWMGWVLGRYRRFLFVRGLTWWVTHIILPLLRTRSWLRRAATIFVNNCSILALVVALGAWPYAAVTGAAFLGISLGTALRVLSSMDDDPLRPKSSVSQHQWLINVGVALNMLEPPAIVAALGLSIGRQSASLTHCSVWQTFGVTVLPALVIAAAGEALWLGACYDKRDTPHSDAPEPEGPCQPM